MGHGRRLAASLLLAALGFGASGCFLFLPRAGTDVLVDSLAGDFWSGEGKLVEVSPDRKLCRVYVRSTSLVVEGKWVDCTRVHPRTISPGRVR